MKNIDEMLNEIGENKEIKEGGNMMTSEEKQRILTRTMEKIGRIEAESNIAAADGKIYVTKIYKGCCGGFRSDSARGRNGSSYIKT